MCRPTHKVILCTNHKPVIGGTDEAIWRRLRLVPFTVTYIHPADPHHAGKKIPPPWVQDKTRGAKLLADLPGVLGWCVAGRGGRTTFSRSPLKTETDAQAAAVAEADRQADRAAAATRARASTTEDTR